MKPASKPNLPAAALAFSYRPAARMKTTPDSGQIHLGFRCVMSAAAWRENPSAK